jgi:hypothetical protein
LKILVRYRLFPRCMWPYMYFSIKHI